MKAARVVEPVKVVEAVSTKPLWNSRVVPVAFSPVPKVLNGKAKVRLLIVLQPKAPEAQVKALLAALQLVERPAP